MIDTPYCATCKRALNTWRERGGPVTYLHTHEGADHDPRPVPLAELPDAILICDFCSEVATCSFSTVDIKRDSFTTYARASRSVGEYHERHNAARIEVSHGSNRLVGNMGERWASCEPCADLIDARDLYGLVARVVDRADRRLQRGRRLIEYRGELITMYTNVLEHVGPRLPLREER